MRAFELESGQTVDEARLERLGVFHRVLDADSKGGAELEALCKERGYKNRDEVNIQPSTIPNYEEKMAIFFTEHLHEDEEIRFILDGSGYFDVRDVNDQWIRLHVAKNDLIILPSGVYHRFTTDENKFIHAMRLFQDDPKWTPVNRGSEADATQSRQAYLEQISKKRKRHENGESFVLNKKAKSLANYPHMRAAGGFLFVSGISSRRPDNTHRGATQLSDGSWQLDAAEQTCGVIDNLAAILQARGADLSHLVDLTCFLVDMQHYAAFNEAYNRYFDAETGPTRTTVAVKQLPHPNLLIEIKAVAVDPQAAQPRP